MHPAEPTVAIYCSMMAAHWHVSSVHNRDSISEHGLDWRRMGAAPGIAGSTHPEQPGCFLVDDVFLADYFVGMNNTGGPVDVWEISGVQDDALVQSPEGYFYLPGVIPPDRTRLLRRDLPPTAHW